MNLEKQHRRGAWWRAVRARPRLVTSALFGLLLWWLVPLVHEQHLQARILVAWNGAALLYLALALHMALTDTPERMHRRALLQGEGRVGVLVLVVLSAAAVLLAVASQLATVKNLEESQRYLHVALAGLTVVTSWLFTQTLLALHYAHDFYVARARHQADPLVFPGTPNPTYSDFFYFSSVIGTSGQTADVSFNGSALRAVGTLHCILAFFFNATLLALGINVAAGLL